MTRGPAKPIIAPGSARIISATVAKLASVGSRCSLFIDPDPRQAETAAKTGAPMIELHTGAYANAEGDIAEQRKQLRRIAETADVAKSLGLIVNSGHGINYSNIAALLEVADFNELNIGHSIVCRALIVGMERAVAEMKDLIKKYAR